MQPNLYRIFTVSLVLLLVSSCSQQNGQVTTVDANSNKGITIPTKIVAKALPSSGTLFAYLYIDQETTPIASKPVDTNNGQSTFNFVNVTVPVGEHVFTISFKYESPNIKLLTLALATSDVLTIESGSSTIIAFTEQNYVYPDDDSDGLSNLVELSNGTDPLNNDTTPPEILIPFPIDSATTVPLETQVKVEFSEILKSSTLSTTTFHLQGPQGVVQGTKL